MILLGPAGRPDAIGPGVAIYPLSDVPEALDHLSPPRGPGAVPSAPPAPALVDGEAPPGRHPLPAVPRYNFIVPDLCHDMHENISCSQSNRVLFGDTWLSTEVPTILASQAYLNNGALFITWDEGASGDGPIGMIVLSQAGSEEKVE